MARPEKTSSIELFRGRRERTSLATTALRALRSVLRVVGFVGVLAVLVPFGACKQQVQGTSAAPPSQEAPPQAPPPFAAQSSAQTTTVPDPAASGNPGAPGASAPAGGPSASTRKISTTARAQRAPQPAGSTTGSKALRSRTSPLGSNEKCGEASYYGDEFQGRPTASGEPYAHDKLTAAHLSLPHGTRVSVVRKSNGKRVEVKVNDRGPYGDPDRIIDLSRSAFQALGSTSEGVMDVCIHWN